MCGEGLEFSLHIPNKATEMKPIYGECIEGLTKFKRMVENPHPKHVKVIGQYYVLLSKNFDRLDLNRFGKEYKMLLNIRAKLVVRSGKGG